MAARALGGTHLTLSALDLGPQQFVALARAHERIARARGRGAAAERLGYASVIAFGVAGIVLAFVALGSPAWLGAVVAVGAFGAMALRRAASSREVVIERHARAA